MEVPLYGEGLVAGHKANLGAIGAIYNLTMDPYEKYDMTFNGAAPARVLITSPGRYAGQDNGWALALLEPVILEFDKSIMKYPNIRSAIRAAPRMTWFRIFSILTTLYRY